MKPAIVAPVATALSLILAPGAWAHSVEPSRLDAEQHWMRMLRHQLDAGFEAPAMSYRDQELTTEVTFDLGQDGRIQNLQVRRSSGSEPLDRAVLDAVLKADDLPAPPAWLRGSKVIFRGSVDATRRFGRRH